MISQMHEVNKTAVSSFVHSSVFTLSVKIILVSFSTLKKRLQVNIYSLKINTGVNTTTLLLIVKLMLLLLLPTLLTTSQLLLYYYHY